MVIRDPIEHKRARATAPFLAALAALASCATLAPEARVEGSPGRPWPRHVIDGSSRGADGTKLADVNGDGLMDIICAWEEGGVVRVYLNPGPARASRTWADVTVGRVTSGEDAVACDVDRDGAVDIVSCCEGGTKSVYVHWAPKDAGSYLDDSAWTTAPVPASRGKRWMFCEPIDVGGRPFLAAGTKGSGGGLGLFELPDDPRDVDAWRWRKLSDVAWVMSIKVTDMDGDGRADILFTDRMGKHARIAWLRNPGDARAKWREIVVDDARSAKGNTYCFLDEGDVDGDGLTDLVCACKPKEILWCRRLDASGERWETHSVEWPAGKVTGSPKAVAVGDVDRDGRNDVVISCEHAKGLSGVAWFSYETSPTEKRWRFHDIAGPEGIKFDMVKLLDLDSDGDLDVLTCEERELNAVIWYENPSQKR